jgi:hypothetical protein
MCDIQVEFIFIDREPRLLQYVETRVLMYAQEALGLFVMTCRKTAKLQTECIRVQVHRSSLTLT